MNRIDKNTAYLNSIDIIKTNDKLPIFNFYNFMNQASTLLECIELLGQIYEFAFDSEDSKSDIFNQKGITGNGTDKKYFQYLRSLCSVHPIETSRHKDYQDDSTKIECCPFVHWSSDLSIGNIDCPDDE